MATGEKMRKLIPMLAACAALFFGSACGGGGDSTTGGPSDGGAGSGGGGGGGTPALDFATILKGTWHGCFPSYAGDSDHTYVFGTTSVSWVTFDYSSTDGSCSGTRYTGWNLGGSYTLGATVAVPFGSGGPTVSARKLDRTFTFAPTVFDIAYIDSTVTPVRLYLGDASTGLMTSDSTRPTLIDPDNVLTKL